MEKVLIYGRNESIIEDALNYFGLDNAKFLNDVISKAKNRAEILEICNDNYKISTISKMLKVSLIRFDIELKLPKINFKRTLQNNNIENVLPSIKMIDMAFNINIIDEIKKIPDEMCDAIFECRISISNPLIENGKSLSYVSKSYGKISKEIIGSNGKGIEKIFKLNDGRTLAQLENEEKQFINPIYISLKRLLFSRILESHYTNISKSNIFFEENPTENTDWKKSSYYIVYENIKLMPKITRVKIYKNVYYYTDIKFKCIRVKISTEDNKTKDFFMLVSDFNKERQKKLINCFKAVYKEKFTLTNEIMEFFQKL